MGSLGLLLFGTGCPQLLDDFSERDPALSRPEPAAGSGGGGPGASSGMGGTTGASSSGGSGDSGAGGATGSGGTAGGAGAAGSGGSAGGGSIAELRSCPFGEPEPLVGFEFPSGSEWGASLSADGLTLYFAQTASGAGDLYRATRPDRGVTFSAPVALTGLNTDDDEGSPFISRDGLRLYFHSNRPEGLGGKDLYVATRSSVSAEFTSAELLANVNSADFDHLARLSPDELSLWFTSTREGGAGGADLWTASRASIDAAFGTPTVFDAINGSSSDESGGLTQDGLMLIFDSTRDGNSDIFTTTRASVDEAFAAPTRVADVNSTANEYNVFMTLDERELFFSSNRDSPTRHHLFRSLRSCD